MAPFGKDEEAPCVTPLALASVVAFATVCLGFHLAQGWVPLLDSANLAFHEAGHPLVGIVSNRLSVYGGTIFQLAFPVAAAWDFRRRGHAAGFAACGVWLGENLLNVARYMADARSQVLPLVGGGDHDWTEIFSRWGLLAADTRVAGLTRLLAVAVMAASLVWLYRRWRREGGD
ncbi:MAG: hypothetical protein IPL06_12640 [Betaproteobacteria bacterium]|nr:hypothetical protein [Betaproteobacteria bacterium]